MRVPGLGVLVCLLFGPLPVRILVTLVMLAWVLSASGARLFLSLLLPLPPFLPFILRTGLLDFFSRLALIFFVVVYWFQGAASDQEKLARTEALLDAVFCELAAVSRGQPCLIVGDLSTEPAGIPCLLKGISAGSWFDLQEAWALASGTAPGATYKHSFASKMVVPVGTLLLAVP